MERQEKRASFFPCMPALISSSIQRALIVTQLVSLHTSTGQIVEYKKCYCRLVSIYFTPSLWPRPTPLNMWLALSSMVWSSVCLSLLPLWPPASSPVLVWDCGCLCQLSFPLREMLKTWLWTMLCLPSLFVAHPDPMLCCVVLIRACSYAVFYVLHLCFKKTWIRYFSQQPRVTVEFVVTILVWCEVLHTDDRCHTY